MVVCIDPRLVCHGATDLHAVGQACVARQHGRLVRVQLELHEERAQQRRLEQHSGVVIGIVILLPLAL